MSYCLFLLGSLLKLRHQPLEDGIVLQPRTEGVCQQAIINRMPLRLSHPRVLLAVLIRKSAKQIIHTRVDSTPHHIYRKRDSMSVLRPMTQPLFETRPVSSKEIRHRYIGPFRLKDVIEQSHHTDPHLYSRKSYLHLKFTQRIRNNAKHRTRTTSSKQTIFKLIDNRSTKITIRWQKKCFHSIQFLKS
ncbi:hypothetical protein EVA_12315 [gut metagenome]|uniref:Uncharacterized protein n=1 Tax=gut metagenome TaxID=749906 RepID=J9GCV4_9ZZZZ